MKRRSCSSISLQFSTPYRKIRQKKVQFLYRIRCSWTYYKLQHKASKRKSRLDKDDKKLKQSDHRRDVVFQSSHTLAPGKQNHDGGHINQRVQRRSQYNSRPENNIAYYYDRPVMSYGEAWWPYVGNYPYPFGYERQRRPYEYHHQRGNTFSWSSDC
ncbi:unnamed protein product [Mytilus edulis]|uniref:Uncharacterized protein n=1 Tax=Mytilus edulis TaxID=6550 RepID=A0A8S3TCK1_MYTED|nr:unnamed protein product [Mytilus edulis]